MSANFWLSSHGNHWLFDRQKLYQARAEDFRYAKEQEIGWIGIWSANVMTRFAKRLGLRQQSIASAIVFFRRFYTRNSYSDTDPCLVAATCIYVAAKVEEQPVHVKSVMTEAKQLFQEMGYTHFPTDHHKLAEMEFYLIEDIDFHMVIHHPYKALLQMCARDSYKLPGMLDIDESTFQMAWFIINDTYRSSLCLLQPPHLIAVAAIYLAFAINPPPKKPSPVWTQAQSQLKHASSAPSPTSTDPSSNSGSKSNPPSAAPSPTNPSFSLPPRPGSATNPKLLHPSLPARPNFDAFQHSNSGRTSPRPSSATPTSHTSQTMQPTASTSAPASSSAALPSKRDPVTFLAELNVPLSVVLEIIQEIISLYSLWHAFEEGPAASGSGGGGNVAGSPNAGGNGPSASLVAQMLNGQHGQSSHQHSQNGSGSPQGPTNSSSGSQQTKLSPDERIIRILSRIRDARSMDPAAVQSRTVPSKR